MTRPCRAGVLVLAGIALACPPAAAQERGQDPALEQTIDASQAIRKSRTVLDRGHVDVGPLFADGGWKLMIHDDSRRAAGAESVWRHPEQTVLRVSDAARRPVPDDPTYAFLGVTPGTPVFVVPETQDEQVVWLGWNTQDPKVMDTIDRGARMTLTGVEGPGDLVVYLQSGSFSEPNVLWDSRSEPEAIWLDVNTHTHANWVFTEPGVHLVRIRIESKLLDGTKVSDTRELRVAVGSDADADEAFAARWTGPDATAAAAPAPAVGDDEEGSGWPIVIVAIVLAGLLLAGGLVTALRRSGSAKREARGGA